MAHVTYIIADVFATSDNPLSVQKYTRSDHDLHRNSPCISERRIRRSLNLSEFPTGSAGGNKAGYKRDTIL